MVEFAAIMAVMFQNFGLEFDLNAVGKNGETWIDESEVNRLGKQEAMKRAYARKTKDADRVFKDSVWVLTTQMKEEMSYRWVKKGTELWRPWTKDSNTA